MNENNLKIQKIKKSSKVALILARVAKIFCIVMSVLIIGCGFGFMCAKNFLDQSIERALGEGTLTAEELYVNGSGFLDTALNLGKVDSVAVTLGAYLILMGAILICLAIIFHFMVKIFKGIMESYSPFRPVIVKNMKVVFVLITLLTLRSSLLIGVVMGFSLWCILQIFEYGCELQRQSGETL